MLPLYSDIVVKGKGGHGLCSSSVEVSGCVAAWLRPLVARSRGFYGENDKMAVGFFIIVF